MGELSLMIDGLGIPESTRWRDGKVWLCNWGAGEVLAVTADGERELIAQLTPQTLPFSIDWLPDGRLLTVDGPRRLLLGLEADGTLAPVADLSSLGEGRANELVVDGVGRAYVNGGAGSVALVTPDGSAETVAGGLKFPNGMALIDQERTLIVADSYVQALIAYEVREDGSLSDGRVWAKLEHAPDGICADDDGAVWVATVPGRQCIRVRGGGEVLDTVPVDRGCFACMLGGDDGRTLFIA
ncbi:MAG: SMP-30/gluconolactonase/LRE family protein, partial [Solirubrobacterales bacterium]|nr:SMP-30/gluconolactonase/LRE family protein [Solirubrobacterales bacterium]